MFLLEKILAVCRSLQLRLRKEKCTFLVNEVKWAGRVISADGIRPDPEKMQVALEAPAPTTKSELRQWLHHLARHLRPHFAGFSHWASFLWPVVADDGAPFRFEEEQQFAFSTLRQAAASELLKSPD